MRGERDRLYYILESSPLSGKAQGEGWKYYGDLLNFRLARAKIVLRGYFHLVSSS